MNTDERRYCMMLLKRTQNGDVLAYERLTSEIARHFSWMIRGYHSVDPAWDWDDLLQQFQMGIWQAVPKLDYRGDPLYHLAWRGKCAVGSLLKAIKTRRHGTAEWVRDFGSERSIGTLPEGFDIPDVHPESQPDHAIIAQAHRNEARQHIHYILNQVELTSRQWDVIYWMVGEEDTEAKGANLSLAAYMRVSPQMASKHRRTVMDLLTGGPQITTAQFVCLRCKRGFASKGALTQHKNGQSGHKACTGGV